MAAYGALVPLKSRIRGFLKHYDACFDPTSLEFIQNLYKEVNSFQQFIENLDSSSRKRMSASLARIAEVITQFRELLSLHFSDQYQEARDQRNRMLQGDESNRTPHLINLRHLKRDFHSFIETLKKVQEEDESSSSRIDGSRGNKSKMVGLSDLYTGLKEDIVRVVYYGGDVKLHSISIVGMAGIGKTTLAEKIFEDLDIVEWFDCRAWVVVGREWKLQEIIRGIVAQVWDEVNELLKTSTQIVVGSHVLLTSTIQEVVDHSGLVPGLDSLDMPLLNKEESWDLLRDRVFGVESCSFQLERAGRRIAEKCDGLPLTIITVAGLLSEAEKTPEQWNEVATQKKHQIFAAAYDQVSKVLYPSYENLPQHLKICILHMGVFPKKYEIPTSKVINMWIAEGVILEPNNKAESSKKHAMKCLDQLASNSVVMVHKKSTKSSSKMSIADEGIKICGLHSSWWHLCYKEARKINFFHILNNLDDSLGESIKGQSRLSIHTNILLGFKEVYDSIEDNCASSACSLLFYGPYNRYPIPICSALKLLRVLDALTVRFYEFPLQVLELVELRYLALTYDGKLPPSVSKLQKLHFLIVRPHQNIGALLYLPPEIWDLKELKHLQVIGSDLPDFRGTHLPNLSTLLDVGAHSCTKGVFERVHNLRKLGIRIELAPDHSDEPLSCLDHVSNLKELKSLKCVVVNPELTSELVPPPTLPIFPSYLKKLALSGMGYPWAEMSKIASLKKLEVLKLRCNAFQGPKWEIEENTFQNLEYLLIEDSDLEHWKVGLGNFKWLEHLSIKHCYKLTKIDWECEDNISMIEDCLDNFKDQNEFYYEKGQSKNEKWWIPMPKVPPNGLSENGKAILGDAMYKSITDDFFDPDVFLSVLHLVLDFVGCGHAILESYSRIIESLAFTVLSRIDDVMFIDSEAREQAGLDGRPLTSPGTISDQENGVDSPSKTTLLDFIGWENGETEAKTAVQDEAVTNQPSSKPSSIALNKRFIEKLENLGGMRSPTSRH
ncbi:hypothetical protein C2S52_005625 [Perilla frutescens var. hirtella]|nr:hypothetical protein C2S52_005625 [Perilla frutescens var. hirtella]